MKMSSSALCDNSENTCVVCFKNVSIYSVGECDHPVCYECSTRMRVLCRQNECPICRQDMPKVIFTRNVQPFKNIKNNSYLMDKKYKICFDNAEIHAAYNKLLEHSCKICPGRPAFRTFQNLKDHMRKEHELYYCDLCVENLKIFTGERRCYTRQELAQHRRKGDPDDRSHRGHPLCEFCDQRYMDNDELFRHLRRDHLFCHFCDADGFHRYYSSYEYLREHFRTEHFLCEEGSCVDEKFTSAFRTEIDLKAHRALVHGRGLSKAQAKQARTLELEFNFAPRPRPGGGERGGDRGGDRGGSERGGGARRRAEDAPFSPPEEPTPSFTGPPPPRTLCSTDFPSLNASGPAPPASAPPMLTRPNGLGNLTIRTLRQPTLAVTDADFPALHLSVNNTNATAPAHAPNVSIRVNRRADGAVTTRLTGGGGGGGTARLRADDFPSLAPATSASAPAPPAGQWLHVDKRGRPKAAHTTVTAPPPKAHPGPEDFPSLAAPSTSKKASSSVLIPVSASWNGTTAPASRPPAPSLRTSAPVPTSRTPAPAPVLPPRPAAPEEPLTSLAAIKVKSTKKKKPKAEPKKKEESPKEPVRRKKKDEEATIAEQLKSARLENGSASPPSDSAASAAAASAAAASAAAASAAADRKRTELLIASLRPSPPPSPPPPPASPPPSPPASSRPSPPASPVPPPGFAVPAARKPPPGFATPVPVHAPAPPPGFSSVTVSSIARAPAPSSSGLTFTSSSGRSYAIGPREPTTVCSSTSVISSASSSTNAPASTAFAPPKDAERRNQALVQQVSSVVSSIDEFLQLSALFRAGALPGTSFHTHCRRLLADRFDSVFPEMLVLLPDIAKQQELLAAHEAVEGRGTLSLRVCAVCSQVLAPDDVRSHEVLHHANKCANLSAKLSTTKAVGQL